MLISTKGLRGLKLNNYSFQLDLNFPKIFLDKFDYKISVRTICLESTSGFRPCRFSLRSTLVDKNALNPNQEILSFAPKKGSNYIHYSPRNLFEYKVQLKDVHTADFILTCTKEVDLEALRDLYFIFEISRDVRIQ